MFDLGPFLHESPRDREERARLQRFVETHGKQAFSRDPFIGGHVTGSGFILSPDRQKTLLTHHAKLDRWLQLGGHCDGICDPQFVALKEAYEESGLARISLVSEAVFDVDIHTIPANRKEPEHLHYDMRFLMLSADEEFVISSESKDLRWVPLVELEQLTKAQSVVRLRDKALAFLGG